MPSKRRKPNPSSSDAKYLFVNEDANTVLSNTRDAELDRTKQSHVQRRHFEKRRGEVANETGPDSSTARASPIEVQALNSPPSGPGSGPSHGVMSSSDYLQFFDSSILSDNLLPDTLESDLYHDLSFLQPQTTTFSTTSPPPTSTLTISRTLISTLTPSQPSRRASSETGNIRDERPTSQNQRVPSLPINLAPPIDSFYDAYSALQRWAPPLIQYYTTVVVPHFFVTELRTVPIQLMRHTPALHAEMQACMTEAVHMYSHLAAVSARMLRYEGRLFLPEVKPEDYARVPLFFKTKAITSLRQQLERGQLDHSLAQDVFRLWINAAMMDDRSAADAHFQAMMEMVRHLGGLDTLDQFTKERIILLDNWQASWTLSAPRLQLTWDPGYLPGDFRSEICSDAFRFALRPGFARLENSSLLDAHLTGLLASLSEVIDLTRYSFTQSLAAYHFQWLLLRRTAIEHRLLVNLAPADDEHVNIVAESIKLATLIWTGNVLADENKQLLSHQVHVLRNRLESHDSEFATFEAQHAELLLWIASTGALATINEDDQAWFENLAERLATELNAEAAEGMENMLRGFLYIGETERARVVRLIDKFPKDSKGKGKSAATGGR